MTGIRQLRRTRPLETEEIEGLRVPTLAEMARIKAWLLATRHTVRDYLDAVVLLERLGDPGAEGEAFSSPSTTSTPQTDGPSLPWPRSWSGWRARAPSDAPPVDLGTYKALVAPWNDWTHVAARGRHWAQVLSASLLRGDAGGSP